MSSKIAIINDTHLGARQESLIFANYFNRFYRDIFFPKIKEEGIDTVLHLGDFFDRRKFVNYNILKQAKQEFLKPLEENGIHMHLILGNHDCYHKTSSDLNSPSQVFGDHPNVTVYTEPEVIEIQGTKIALCPWINSANREQSTDFIKSTPAPILMGHFEIAGFQVMRGIKMTSGMDKELFRNYDAVFSGHFHHKHRSGNIRYLGSPYQITFADCGDRKGFHTFEPTTKKLKFIENPYTMFRKLDYDDSISDYTDFDASDLTDAYIKITVINKKNPSMFDAFLDTVNRSNPASVKITEIEFESGNITDDISTEDTLTILQKYVDNLELSCDKDILKSKLAAIYNEALEIGS